MASRAYETTMESCSRSLWLIWSATVASVPLLGLYGYAITHGEVPMSPPLWYQIAIGGAVLLMGAMAVWVPRHMLSNRVVMEHVRRKARESGNTGKVSGSLAPREERLVSLAALYKRPFVMGLALGHMIALLSVVYALLSAQLIPMVGLLLLSVAVHVFNRPALDVLTQRASRYLPEDRAPPPTAWPTQQTEF